MVNPVSSGKKLERGVGVGPGVDDRSVWGAADKGELGKGFELVGEDIFVVRGDEDGVGEGAAVNLYADAVGDGNLADAA